MRAEYGYEDEQAEREYKIYRICHRHCADAVTNSIDECLEEGLLTQERTPDLPIIRGIVQGWFTPGVNVARLWEASDKEISDGLKEALRMKRK